MIPRPAALIAAPLFASLLFCAFAAPPAHAEDAALKRAKRLLARTILVDGHNDLPITIRSDANAPRDVDAYDLRTTTTGQTDLARLKAGGVDAQFWSVYIPGEAGANFARTQLEQIDIARRMIARYPEALEFVTTADGIRRAHRAGRIGSLLGMEGGHALENSLGALRAYFDLGVRYMTLTHNTHTDWADSAAQVPAKFDGLSEFGREVVREMNRLGMMVDLSHTATATMHDTLDITTSPVIFSHAAARALCDIPRNVPDDVIARLPANGGVLMVTFVAGFLSPETARAFVPAIQEYRLRIQGVQSDAEREEIWQSIRANLVLPPTSSKDVADHIEYIVKVSGIDNVGIGGDYDGNDLWPSDLTDVSMYPNLFAELIRRGWSDRDLEKLAGKNILRVMEANERRARELQRTTPASTKVFIP
jgi:membrane dipeptidase